MTTDIHHSVSDGCSRPNASGEPARDDPPASASPISSWVYPRDVRALVALGHSDRFIAEIFKLRTHAISSYRARHDIPPAKPEPRYCEFCVQEISYPASWGTVRYAKMTVCQRIACQKIKKKRVNEARVRTHQAKPGPTAAQRAAEEARVFAGLSFTDIRVTPDRRPLPGRPDPMSYVGCAAASCAL